MVFGGVGQTPQVAALRRGVDVLVAAPGRLLDLIGQGHCDLSKVEVLVLDEADRMLDMGFSRDIARIVARLPKARQTLLFSATMPDSIAALAGGLLRDPARVEVAPPSTTVGKRPPARDVRRCRQQTGSAGSVAEVPERDAGDRLYPDQARRRQGHRSS